MSLGVISPMSRLLDSLRKSSHQSTSTLKTFSAFYRNCLIVEPLSGAAIMTSPSSMSKSLRVATRAS